ncbi:MAG TPA: FkbM family methyltransferase, partial [Rudaea sp.]
MPILQGPLRWRLWIPGSSSHGCWLGSYEYDKQRLFARVARSGDVVFDIGANVGFYTLLAATCVAPTGRVVAFEPMPSNVKRIHQHLKLNRIGSVHSVEAAVSS